MSFQDSIWLTTLVGITGVALVFLYVISQSGGAAWICASERRA